MGFVVALENDSCGPECFLLLFVMLFFIGPLVGVL